MKIAGALLALCQLQENMHSESMFSWTCILPVDVEKLNVPCFNHLLLFLPSMSEIAGYIISILNRLNLQQIIITETFSPDRDRHCMYIRHVKTGVQKQCEWAGVIWSKWYRHKRTRTHQVPVIWCVWLAWIIPQTEPSTQIKLFYLVPHCKERCLPRSPYSQGHDEKDLWLGHSRLHFFYQKPQSLLYTVELVQRMTHGPHWRFSMISWERLSCWGRSYPENLLFLSPFPLLFTCHTDQAHSDCLGSP